MTTPSPTTSLRAARARRTPTTSGVIGALNCEWAHLAQSPTRSHGTSWATLQPALTGLDTLGQVRVALSAAHAGARVDAILLALLTLHAQEHPHAGRTVLQTMLGKTMRLSYTARNRLLLDPQESAVAAMWAAIDSYPLRRATKVAANLSLEALRLIDAQGTHLVPCDDDKLTEHIEQAQVAHRLPSPVDEDHETVVDALLWASQTGSLTRSELQLLARMHLADDAPDVSLAQVADELGLSYAATRQRYSRAVRRLAAAVHDAIQASPR